MPGKVLQLISVGGPPPGLMKELEEPLLTQMGVTAVQGRVPLTTPVYAYNKTRSQYHSNAIMRRLAPLKEAGQSFVLGIADVDLFVPDSAFVFGEADRESHTAVLSIFRLRTGPNDYDGMRRRTQVEAVHQAGHLVGLSYCDDPRCVMFLASTTGDCDRKTTALCNVCRNELTKLNR
jgi:archaemetzincin